MNNHKESMNAGMKMYPLTFMPSWIPYSFLLLQFIVVASAAVAAGPVSTPATDAVALALMNAGTLNHGSTIGADNRAVAFYIKQDASALPVVKQPALTAPAPSRPKTGGIATLIVNPSEITLNAGGQVSASVTGPVIKLSGMAFNAGDMIRIEFNSGRTWLATTRIGSKFNFTTAIPGSSVQLSISGDAALSGGECAISMSSVKIKYAAVEFMTAREWTVRAIAGDGRGGIGVGAFKIRIQPGTVIAPEGKLIER